MVSLNIEKTFGFISKENVNSYAEVAMDPRASMYTERTSRIFSFMEVVEFRQFAYDTTAIRYQTDIG